MTFEQFVQQYNGVANVGNTPENLGQCVGLSAKWIEDLGLPHVWGNAISLLDNADQSAFIKILNSPTNAPSEGDIVVLGAPYGKYTDSTGAIRYYGHTGIATKNCTDAILELFEQDDPYESTPHVKVYDYLRDNCLGWIHPRVLSGTQTAEVPPTVEQVQLQLKTQVDATSQCLTQLKQAQDQTTLLQQQLQTETDKNATLTQQVTDLQSKHGEDQQEIITLNGSLENLAKSNKDYASEVVISEAEVNNLKKYFYAIVDKLGITRTNLKDSDVAEKSLAVIDGMDKEITDYEQQITTLKKKPLVTPQMILDIKKKNYLMSFLSFLVSRFVQKNA